MNNIVTKNDFPQHDLLNPILSPQLIEKSPPLRRNSLELSYLDPKREESSLAPSEIETTENTHKISSIQDECANLFNCQEVKGNDFNAFEEVIKLEKYLTIQTSNFLSAMLKLGNSLKRNFSMLLFLFVLYVYSRINYVLCSHDQQF